MKRLSVYTDELFSRLTEIINYIDYIEANKKVPLMGASVSYNAVIISLYGCFENYIDRIFSEYLDMIHGILMNYNELPDKLREKHMIKTGEYISNPSRYQNYELSINDAISNLYMNLNGNLGAVLNKNLILSHGGNLRIKQILDIISDVGIEKGREKIVFAPLYMEFYAKKNDINLEQSKKLINEKIRVNFDILFNELDDLVEQRNKVAHGWVVDERISYPSIKNEIIPFIHLLGSIILSILSSECASIMNRKNDLKAFPKAIDVFNHHILCINNLDAHLKVNECIYAEYDGNWFALKIINIQINKCDFEEVTESNIDVGIQIEQRIDKDWNYYYI